MTDPSLAPTQPQAGVPDDLSTDADPLQTGRVVDRYVILNRIGHGGMGVVYAAYDPQLDRKVAIKILRPGLASDAAKQRLLREAQAMARVSHPNVMRVYDVGTVEGLVFMAMELVDGETLAELLNRTRPAWRETLRLFLAAGRGLAAAHAAGLVHRDFKPGNVLVAKDSSVRVIDFGLAREDKGAAPYSSEVPQHLRESSGPTALDVALTHQGAFLGTPPYMSPEQLTGQNADARSDQFVFCVAVHQALYQSHPFPSQTVEELYAAIISQRLFEPPRSSPVPGWVRRALLRGLLTDPAKRWPSMDALLAALEKDPGARLRRRVATAAALGAVAVTGVAWQLPRARARDACLRAGDQLAQLWNPDSKARVHRTFAATAVPFAEDAWASTAHRLDSYTSGWKTMRTETCDAPPEERALKVGCLSLRAQEFSALLEVLNHADGKVVQGAVSAAHALSSISGCEDLVALRAARPPPADPLSRAKIESARAELAAAKSLADSGDVATAFTQAKQSGLDARAVGFAPLIAEALVRQGELEGRLGDRKAAEATLQEAVWFAQTGNSDELAARAWNQLGFLVGYELNRHAEGEAFCRYAAAMIERQGGNAELSADNLRFTGLVLEQEGKFDQALKVMKQSLELREKLLGAEHPAVATSASSVGNVYIMMEQYALARPFHERALAIRLKLLGPSHPDVSTSYHNLGIDLSHLGEREKAIEILGKALEIDSGVFGPHSDHAAQSRQTLAKTWFDLHRREEAREAATIALEDLSQAFGPESPVNCPPLHLLGRIALADGKVDQALALFEKGLAIREKQMGPDHEIVGEFLWGIGEARLALGQPKVALESFQRAAHLHGRERDTPEERARVDWGLARAIWESHGSAAEAIAHAQEAKRLYALAIDPQDEAKQIDAWLEARTH